MPLTDSNLIENWGEEMLGMMKREIKSTNKQLTVSAFFLQVTSGELWDGQLFFMCTEGGRAVLWMDSR